MARKILLFLLITCSSCSSVYRFSINVQEPAAVTLPVSAQNVLILNNTVIQPNDLGIERNAGGKPIGSIYPLSMDSLAWFAINEITHTFNESNFFNTIAIYKNNIRMDSDWLSVPQSLSPELQSEFYNDEDFSALLVINRLLFSVKEDITNIKIDAFSSLMNVFLDLHVDGSITCSMYVHGKEKPLTTFTVSDSLFVKSMIYSDSTDIFKDIPEYILHELSGQLGNKVAEYFIPAWKTANRLVFTDLTARMKEATGYASGNRWANAETIWNVEFEKATKPLNKAKIAFNLAVANEMQDRLDSAWEWAQKAKEYLKNTNQSDNSQEIELTDNYISELERRIQSNRLLDLQWGK